jgi:hypothetical protein
MKTEQDLKQMYRTAFGYYPDITEYADWLEEIVLNEMNKPESKKHSLQSVFDDQMKILDLHYNPRR